MSETIGERIDGGWHIRELPNGRCIDIMQMLYNYRVVISLPGHKRMDHGWCFFGFGCDAAGKPRTMETALLTAVAAVGVWDGAGDPPFYDKKVF